MPPSWTAMNAARATQWQCPCGFKNKAMNSVCGGGGPMGCKAPRGQSLEGVGYGPARRKAAGSAGAASAGAAANPYLRGEPVSLAQSAAGTWECSGCNFKNKPSNILCGGTGPMGCKLPGPFAPAEGVAAGAEALEGLGLWVCKACGFKNRDANQVCGGTGTAGCKTPKGAESYSPSSAGMKRSASTGNLQDGWVCRCGFMNRRANDVCGGLGGTMGCKAPKIMGSPMGGSPMANPMMQLFGMGMGLPGMPGMGLPSMSPLPSPRGNKVSDIWICSCGFKNASRNTQCGGSGPMGCKEPAPKAWKCQLCDFNNKAANAICGGSGPLGCKASKAEGESKS